MRSQDWLPATVRAATRERRLKSGEALFRLGDKALGPYEVVKGRIRLVRTDRAGREIVLHVAGAGETVAEASLFSPQYHCDALASGEAVVRLHPKKAVLAAFEADPRTLRDFAAALARQVMRLRSRIEQRNIRSARERVRHYLALQAGADGRTVELRGTLKEVAGELGLTHEALYRTLAALERAGEIKRPRGRIVLKRTAPL